MIKTIWETISNFIEKHYKIIFTMIVCLDIFLNIYKLGEVPQGIHVDEAGMTYDAYCIANYGVDRFLKQFPVYFINFGGGQNALYTYLTAILIKICGRFDLFIIRMPALIFSVIEVIVVYLLGREFFSKKKSLLFMLLVVIEPWHIMKSRWGLESFLLSPMLLFSTYALIKAIKTKKLFAYIISGILFGITLYTYAISYLVIPIFLGLMLIYLIRKRMITIKQIIALFIPIIIFAIPLVLMLMVQKGWINEIDSFITIPLLPKNRTSEIDISYISNNIKYLQFAFINDELNYNSIKGFGSIYYVGIALMLLGIETSVFNKNKFNNKLINSKNNNENDKEDKIKNQEISLTTIMSFMFISNFILAILTEVNTNKLNGIYISVTFFVLVGLEFIYKNAKYIFTILMIVYMMLFSMFTNRYFTTFAKQDYDYFDNGDLEIMNYIKKYDGKEIYTDYINYIYSLIDYPISPYDFYKDIEIYKGIEVIGYKNYHSYIDYNNLKDDAIYVLKTQSKVEYFTSRGYKLEIVNNKYYILQK